METNDGGERAPKVITLRSAPRITNIIHAAKTSRLRSHGASSFDSGAKAPIETNTFI